MEEWDEHEQDCLVPLYFDALDSILLEKFKDILGYFMGGVGGGSEAHLPFGNEHKVGQDCDNDRAKGRLVLPGRIKRDTLEGAHSVHCTLEGV